MKKKFKVSFYYFTDLRHSTSVEAVNEVYALAIAVNEEAASLVAWCDNSGFRIEIERE